MTISKREFGAKRECACGCGAQLSSKVRDSDGRIRIRKFLPYHHNRIRIRKPAGEFGNWILCGCGCGGKLRERIRYKGGREHRRTFITGHNPSRHGRQIQDRLAPVEHPSLYDIVWFAGIYEGEGSVSNSSQAPYVSLSLSVAQKDPWILIHIQRLFGGSVRKRKSKNSEYSVWAISGARARGIAMTIFKFLSPRRQNQIMAVL